MTEIVEKDSLALKADYDCMIARANTYRKGGDIVNANAFDNIASKIKAIIDSQEPQKKNESTSGFEPQSIEPTATAEAKGNASANSDISGFVDNPVSLSTANTEGVTVELDLNEKYKFDTIDDFKEYKFLKDKLRDMLRNWLRKKNKTAFDYSDINQRVLLCIEYIEDIITRKARTDYKSDMMKTRYEIGDKALMKELGKDNISFSFDINQLKKDFEF